MANETDDAQISIPIPIPILVWDMKPIPIPIPGIGGTLHADMIFERPYYKFMLCVTATI